MPPGKKPQTITVHHGSVTVRIFPCNTGKYRAWEVVHSFSGTRHRRKFSELKLARAEAEAIARRLDQGNTILFSMTAADQATYAAALERIRDTGRSLDAVAGEYAQAMGELGRAGLRVSLAEVVRDYVRRHPAGRPERTVGQVVEEILATRQADGVGPRHLADLRSRLGRFAAAFQMPAGSVAAQAVDEWLRGLRDARGRPLGPRSRNNYRLALANLFGFARRRRYLPADWDEIERVELAKIPRRDPRIFTPDQMSGLLAAAPQGISPVLAIGAFAGLRTSEIQRLDWRDVRLDEGHIVVPVQSKTGRRLAPLPPNLRAWLAPMAASGPVCRLSNVANAFHRLSAQAGLPWVHNGLRHSFVSYRVAAIQNVEQVSLECGHSVSELRESYRELVTQVAAGEWFKIEPK